MQTFSSFIIRLSIIWHTFNASYLNYEDGTSVRTKRLDYQEFEPVTLYSRNLDKVSAKNINCEDFSSYAVNCTIDAALIYNSSRMSPPPTTKIYYWCKAIRYLTNCAIDWNSDCKNVTDSHFNEESVKGHIHVVNNICDDDWFLLRYEDLPGCIESGMDSWEACYSIFKDAVQEQKNTTYEWTHYEVHFQLCCWLTTVSSRNDRSLAIVHHAGQVRFGRLHTPSKIKKHAGFLTMFYFTVRSYPNGILCFYDSMNCTPLPISARASFRRCTLESIFHNTHCTPEQAVTLQKFSVIVSEGAVYQDCDHNMMYANCPGGDPRPSRALLKGLMTADANRTAILHLCIRIAIYIQAIVFIIIYFL